MAYSIGDQEKAFLEIIWKNEPINSGKLAEMAFSTFKWKKSTSYTVLKRLCLKGIVQNENGTVTSTLSEKELDTHKSRDFVGESFGGSLPAFIAAFVGSEKLSKADAEEIREMIDRFLGEEE
ncbi:MAG: BlaI/MecI/CopY family transcriptional regulator [Treponema sp.]|nr:BlaI/MecI/CopY family transcriptional regulator [Treponema sp.]